MYAVEIPEKANFIVNQLLNAGYDTYVVGGCVRDALLGVLPGDWDICTAALPEEIKTVFTDMKTVDTGLRHGTITLVLDGVPYEITTFRTEGGYQDNRRPDFVHFVSEIEADLRRRDFTVNAMAYNYKRGLVDVCGGQTDLENRLLRTVGSADIRFGEDALRIMRCLRFGAVLGFQIEEETSAAVLRNKALLQKIAIERMNTEFSKLICGQNAAPVLLKYRAVLSVFLPELEDVSIAAYENVLALLIRTPAKLSARLASFFSVLPQSALLSLLKRMKYSNQMIKETIFLRGFTVPLPKDIASMKRLLLKGGTETFETLLLLKELLGQNTTAAHGLLEREKAGTLCLRVGQLVLTGNDLMAMGWRGTQLGTVQNKLLQLVMEEKVENTKVALISALSAIKEEKLL